MRRSHKQAQRMALTKLKNPPEYWAGDPCLRETPAVETVLVLSQKTGRSAGWFAVQTKSRAEKALAHHCIAHSIPYFLPMVRSWASSPENKARRTANAAYQPLLPGIMFVAAPFNSTEQEFSSPERPNPLDKASLDVFLREVFGRYEEVLRESRHVFGFLHTKQQDRLAQELCFLASETPDSRTLRAEEVLINGCPVEVREGPFMGLQGRVGPEPLSVEMDTGKVRLHVVLTLLGRPVSVEIDRNLVEAM